MNHLETLMSSDGEDLNTSADGSSPDVKVLILAELRRVNKRLDQVETKVEEARAASTQDGKDIEKLSRVSGLKNMSNAKKLLILCHPLRRKVFLPCLI